MRRVAIFAHYDRQDLIKRYVVQHLVALREVCEEIHFVSTANLGAEELAKLDGIVSSRRVCANVGYDFEMWRQAMAGLVLRDWDELVLTNSSVFGPLAPLAMVFQRMYDSACDFWGMSDNLEFEHHIQSYFLVFRGSVLRSGQLERFFASVLPYQHKWQVIRSYELGLTHFLLDQGFMPDLVASVFDPGLRVGTCNPSICAPIALMERGVPYVKVELLRDNPHQLRLAPVRARMAAFGYPMDLVEPGRQPPRRILWGLLNRLRLQLQRWYWRFRKKPSTPLRPPVAAMLGARRERGSRATASRRTKQA